MQSHAPLKPSTDLPVFTGRGAEVVKNAADYNYIPHEAKIVVMNELKCRRRTALWPSGRLSL
jgi:hypothetical protein